MKKILVSAFTIFAVVAAVGGATYAVFSDTETSTGNTFAAGSIDLKVNGEDDPITPITLSGLQPGDGVGGAEHSTISYSYTLSNSGSLDGVPSIELKNLFDYENDCVEPETDIPDPSCGATEGELSDNLYLQINAPGGPGFVYLHGTGCIDGGRNCPLSTWVAAGVIGGSGAAEPWPTVPAGSTLAGPMVLEFQVPLSVGNIIQSDSVEFDIDFNLDQI